MDANRQGVTFGVLGPFRVEADGRELELGGPRVQAVLALLLAGAERVVSLATLVDALWGSRPPPRAERTVRTYVSRLRRALPAPAAATGPLLVTRPPGYLARPEPDAFDAARFDRLVAAGRHELAGGRPAAAAERLSAALALWRGDPYAEFGQIPVLLAEAARLGQLRLAALADRIDADLASGQGGGLVAELEALTRRYPGHERLWGQLMTALYRAGRQADALAAFGRARAGLVESAGLEPSPLLLDTHRRVLAQDPSLLPPPTANGSLTGGYGGGYGTAPATAAAGDLFGARSIVPPAQLPPAVPAFAGRRGALAALDALLPGPDDGRLSAVAVAVSGTAGVGKTALAVHWGHRVAHRFPDGQLYVDMRGYDPAGMPMDPAQALHRFLDAFGLPAEQIPADPDARAARYRSVLAGKRVLVVLDNVRTVEQVRPLLPGAPGCLAVVTSRGQLTGLVASDGAYPVALDVLTPAEARQLLASRLGADRLAGEPAAVEDIITRCARLPLALAIAAARGQQSGFPLRTLAAELADARDRLDALATGDDSSEIRAVFSWSYDALTPAAARLFRLLGWHPGPDISLPAAASLAGRPRPEVRRLLTELTRANLLGEHAPGRYGFHDLLRAYAADLAGELDTAQQRRAASHRLLDHYLHTAHAADLLLNRHRAQLPVPPARPDVDPEQPADHGRAMAWFAAEHSVLLGAVEHAATTGFDVHAWQLVWSVAMYIDRTAQWQDGAVAGRIAVAAADRLGDPTAQTYAYRLLGRAHSRLGRYDDAARELTHGLEVAARAGDLSGQAHTHHGLAFLRQLQGRHAEGLDHSRRAVALHEAAGDRRGTAVALNGVGWLLAQLGDHRQALAYCERALVLHREVGDRDGQASTWDSLGYAHRRLGEHAEAVACYRQAVDLLRALEDYGEAAETLISIGDTYQSAGDVRAARDAWQQALLVLAERNLDRPEAELARRRLAAAGAPVPAAG